MIEFDQVAELMHDEIIGEMRRQPDDAIIEIEVAVLRAAAPSRPLIADGDFFDIQMIDAIPMRDALMRYGARGLAIGEIVSARCGAPRTANAAHTSNTAKNHMLSGAP